MTDVAEQIRTRLMRRLVTLRTDAGFTQAQAQYAANQEQVRMTRAFSEELAVLTLALTAPARCADCKSVESISFAPCPFAQDIGNDNTPVWLCEQCSFNRAGDI